MAAASTFDYDSRIHTKEIPLYGGQGSVSLVDFSPRVCPIGHTPEYAIVQAARVSYGQGVKTPKEDAALVAYLIENDHTSPLEMASVKFRIVVPKAISIQLLRHRTAKYAHVNELSQRYTEITDEIGNYDPLKWERGIRIQSKVNHQGSVEVAEDSKEDVEKIRSLMAEANRKLDETRELYHKMVEVGLGKEIARFYLPMCENTVLYLEFDLNNFLKFLSLRDDSHAQLEIQEMARAMGQLADQCFPNVFAAHKNKKHGMSLTEEELQAIAAVDFVGAKMSKRKQVAYQTKLVQLGIVILDDTTDAHGDLPVTSSSKLRKIAK